MTILSTWIINMPSHVGIYFSKHLMSIAISNHRKKTHHLKEFFSIQMTDNTVSAKKAALSQIVKKLNFKDKIILGIEFEKVFTQTVTVEPTLSENDTLAFLNHHSNRQYFDFETIKQSETKKEIRVTSVEDRIINQNIELFNEFNLSLHAIDVNTYALYRLRHCCIQQNSVFNLQIIPNNILNHKTNLNALIAIGLSFWSHYS